MELTGTKECLNCGNIYRWMHIIHDNNLVAITYRGRTSPDINVGKVVENGDYYVIVTICPKCGEKGIAYHNKVYSQN